MSYRQPLDRAGKVSVQVRFNSKGPEVNDYAVALLWFHEEAVETIRIYDAAHGFNEMHRFTKSSGKQAGVLFHLGNLGEGMRAAIAEIQHGYAEMIEGWNR